MLANLIRAAATLAAICLVSLSARAGDTASVNILGFSDDGAIFAFEEYGVQDGSGFPYANRFYIDTATDTFVSGTPIRVRLDDEISTVEEARAEARSQGQSIISDAELAANPGFTAGWNSVTELSADMTRIAVNPRPVFPPIDTPVEFRIEEIGFYETGSCDDYGDIKGYRLLRIGTEPGVATELVHEDSSVPSSRGCPLGYMIGGMQTFYPESGPPVYALMLIMRQFGFEGPDHRWLAVAGRL